jgi:hypothetical protein
VSDGPTAENLRKGAPSKPGPSDDFPEVSCPRAEENGCTWHVCVHRSVVRTNLRDHLANHCPLLAEDLTEAKELASRSFEELKTDGIGDLVYTPPVAQPDLKCYPSGMVREPDEDKTNWLLVYDGPLLRRWAELLSEGAKTKGKRNWMNANSEEDYERFRESFARHVAQFLAGDTDVDHAAALVFNLNGMLHVRDKLA